MVVGTVVVLSVRRGSSRCLVCKGVGRLVACCSLLVVGVREEEEWGKGAETGKKSGGGRRGGGGCSLSGG